MRFLVDENLPLALAHWLRMQGCRADHTSTLGFNATSDLDIALAAEQMSAVVVTKDRDYLAPARSGRGPRVIHVRSGNLRTEQLLAMCASVWPAVVDALAAGERVVEIGSAR